MCVNLEIRRRLAAMVLAPQGSQWSSTHLVDSSALEKSIPLSSTNSETTDAGRLVIMSQELMVLGSEELLDAWSKPLVPRDSDAFHSRP